MEMKRAPLVFDMAKPLSQVMLSMLQNTLMATLTLEEKQNFLHFIAQGKVQAR